MQPVVRRVSRFLALSAVGLLFPACTGSIDGARGPGDPNNPNLSGVGGTDPLNPGFPDNPEVPNNPDNPNFVPPRFTCDEKAVSKQQPLRRLTRGQFINTITDVVTEVAGGNAADALKAIGPQLDKFPPDKYTSEHNKGRDGYLRADMDVSQLHADVHMDIAIALGRAMTDTPAERTALLGGCATDASTANDTTCVDDFIRKTGPVILRSPITDADVTFYRKALRGTTASQEAVADVVALLFASPRVLFQIESQSATEPLPANELATRLSYHLWDAPPDKDLRAAVSSGDLNTPEGYRAQIERLLASPRAAGGMERFVEQWFSLYTAPDLTSALGFADYKALVGDSAPTKTATNGMREDVVGLVRSIFDEKRPMTDLLTDRRVYTQDPFVNKIYGTTPGTPSAPESELRAGLITRPAFVASGDYSTHPILKGVRLYKQVLCQHIGDPPADVFDTIEATKPTGPMSSRVEAETLTKPSGCMGCHRVLNPLGFPTENFDSLGRERSEERVFDKMGKLVETVPVNASILTEMEGSGELTINGPVDLLKAIGKSRMIESCFSAQYFRYTFGKTAEDPEADGCLLAALEETARKGGSLQDLVITMAESQAFAHRKVD
ncbi:MAG: DUF1592 domain-containing protein [Deltaproteobacteria bacterium]|nr:DUF1592 domain-containing protein [Deltaproteobacteria bacterium]